MSEVVIGFVVIVGAGLTLLAIAAYADLRAARRVRDQVAAALPTGAPEVDEAKPAYVAQQDAERPQTAVLPWPDDRVIEALRDASPATARLADDAVATHAPPPTAVLEGATVLVCLEGIGSLREVLSTLERAVADRQPLVLVSPEVDDDTLSVVRVNVARGSLQAAVLIADSAACDEIALLSGASLVGRADLQSGYLPHAVYGRVALVAATGEASQWVSTSSET